MKLPKLARGWFTGHFYVHNVGFIMDGRRGPWVISLEVARPYWVEQSDGSTLKIIKKDFVNHSDGFMSEEAAITVAKKLSKLINTLHYDF